MQPGFYRADQLSNEDYHSGPGVSNSGLKLIGQKTPHHYWSRYIDPDRVRVDDSTHAKMVGTAIHAAALEPDRFDEEYVVANFDRRNAAGYKAWAKEQDRHILLPQEMGHVLGMRSALHAHPIARALLSDAYEFELSAYATDPDTGVLCRIRMDLLTQSGWIVDLKKTQDASPGGVARTIANYGYYHQAAFYEDMLTVAQNGECPRGFAFIFVEELPPHAVAVYVLHLHDIDLGRREYRRNLNTYARCLETGEWPGYSQRAETISLPQWARRNIENSLGGFDHE